MEGTKQLVRWTQIYVSQPFSGFFPDDSTQVIFRVVLGVFSVFAGYWFLKLNIKGLFLALSMALLNIISDALSWNLWDPVVKQMVFARREHQGMPVRDGEVELMQLFFPEGIILMIGCVVIAMLFTYKRFKSA